MGHDKALVEVGGRPMVDWLVAAVRAVTTDVLIVGRSGILAGIDCVPDDRPGCYQSRACRDATVYKGYQTQAGFWTYDGEYWYVWEERRGILSFTVAEPASAFALPTFPTVTVTMASPIALLLISMSMMVRSGLRSNAF